MYLIFDKMGNFVPVMGKISVKGHVSMLAANTIWGLMSPIAKIVMAGGVVTPLVVTDLRIFGAMVMWLLPTWCGCLERRCLP